MSSILFLTESPLSPASRFRILPYLPYLERDGWRCDVRAMQSKINRNIYRLPGLGHVAKTLERSKRFFQTRDLSPYACVFQQRFTWPFTSWLENRIQAKARFIFDFDDAIFQSETGPNAKRKQVFDRICKGSNVVVAGSEFLASHVSHNRKIVIPTSIETDAYRPKTAAKQGPLVIGWMGTASNYGNFGPLLPSLKKMVKKNVVLRLVSNQPPPFDLPCEYVPWSAEREVELLQSFDIGIMPLMDSSWNRGKCGFKLIQYMAVGLPVVASAVGANKEIVLDKNTGFLVDANDLQGWTLALEQLLNSKQDRAEKGIRGRERCEKHYAISAQYPKLLNILQQNVSKTCF